MRIKVLYVQLATSSFAGIERVIHEICGEIEQRFNDKVDLEVLYTSDHGGAIKETVYKKHFRYQTSALSLMRNARKLVKENNYDVIVVPQVEPTVLYWLGLLGLKKNIVVYLHGNPSKEMSHFKAKVLFFVLKHIALKHLAGVFGTSPKQLEKFNELFPSSVKRYWLPNPVRQFEEAEEPKRDRGDDLIVFVKVGRFTYQKGQNILVEAFAKVYAQRQDVRLKLVGYGDDEAALRAQVEELGLNDVVWFEYHPNDPGAALQSSDIYVSSARWEGWSLAICEGLRFGLPVIATNCDFGPSDILIDDRLGCLVEMPWVENLTKEMLHYCENLEEQKPHANYRKEYIKRFDVSEVTKEHVAAIEDVFANACLKK